MLTDILRRAAVARALSGAQDRDERRARIAQILCEAYEPAPKQSRVRRTEVVELVARVLGVLVINNALFVEVEAAARTLRWQAIRNGNRALYRCVQPRQQVAQVGQVTHV